MTQKKTTQRQTNQNKCFFTSTDYQMFEIVVSVNRNIWEIQHFENVGTGGRPKIMKIRSKFSLENLEYRINIFLKA